MKLFQVEIERNKLNKEIKKSTVTEKNIIRLRKREKTLETTLDSIEIHLDHRGHKIADKGCLS